MTPNLPKEKVMTWTQEEAIALCVMLESVVPTHGGHIALTGGTLYKKGPRKDCDLLFYRIRQRPCIDMPAMWAELEHHGFLKVSGFGWCYKATYKGKPVDCFFPEVERDANGNEIEYQPDHDAAASAKETVNALCLASGDDFEELAHVSV